MYKKIHIEGKEFWDEKIEQFVHPLACNIRFEHSLYTISKWEEKYHVPFLSSSKTPDQILDYIKMMDIDGILNDEIIKGFSQSEMNEIENYINNVATATTFSKEAEEALGHDKNEIVTAEIIYYWMTAQNIPFECEHWHIQRLITLIKVRAIKNQPEDKKKKKLTSTNLAKRRAQMEIARRKYANK